MSRDLGELLLRDRALLERFLRLHGGGLLRYEAIDDLVQGVHVRALQAASGFEDRGDEAFRGWLLALARRHIADRHDHWSAHKRGAGRVLRLTLHGGTSFGGASGSAIGEPATSRTSPGTFAERREHLQAITRALAALPPRDQLLVRWASEGVPLAEQATRLRIETGAAQRAGLRALDRLRRTLRLLQQQR